MQFSFLDKNFKGIFPIQVISDEYQNIREEKA
jgi:hypothetical protein